MSYLEDYKLKEEEIRCVTTVITEDNWLQFFEFLILKKGFGYYGVKSARCALLNAVHVSIFFSSEILFIHILVYM